MLRSMFTAVSSLNLHQNYLDVIADNLANANTTGFKASRVVFQDQFAQIMSPGSAPTGNQGGINPTQIGLGVQVGYISPLFTQGMLQGTGRNTDLAIQGDGFFVYDQGVDRRYSREGSLEIDANGFLVNNATGLRIQGWTQRTPGKIDTNQPIGDIAIPLDATLARATTTAQLGGNLSSSTPIWTKAGDLTVDSTIAINDSLGATQKVPITFTRVADPVPSDGLSHWSWSAAGETGRLAFDANGQFNPAASDPIDVSVAGANGAAATQFTIDLSKLTQLSADTSVSATSQDGLAAGSVSDVYATPNSGEVYLIYSNGLKQQIGQLALARFTNPTGLMRSGHNLFQAGLNAGEPQIGAADTGGRGKIASGYLEASNVDMAQEFTNMILAQRGFQASSRIISTSDEILQELVNLKR
ncbi:MAG: flagellar hook protein FlgE [Anaerolineaceae bacterium]|nr:flagellar hook protein FlgE [Anaerolineaceae bacterium]